MSENILEVKGLTKDYGDFVLDKLTFTVPKGVIMGLIGENGAGKSIMWFVVENFEVSIAIAGVSVVAICGLSFVLSNLFFRKKYI